MARTFCRLSLVAVAVFSFGGVSLLNARSAIAQQNAPYYYAQAIQNPNAPPLPQQPAQQQPAVQQPAQQQPAQQQQAPQANAGYRNGGQRPDLFYNYYYQYGNNGLPVGMYTAPRPVPPVVGHVYYTYQPFLPHEHLYGHYRTYFNYNGGCLTNRTTVNWTSGHIRRTELPWLRLRSY